MPIKECKIEDKDGFKWGDEGTCYGYDKNSTSSKAIAKEKAAAQGRAIEATNKDK